MSKIKDISEVVNIILGLTVIFMLGYVFGHYVLRLW